MIRLEQPWMLALPLAGLAMILWRRSRRESVARRTVYLELWEKAAQGSKIWERWRWTRQEWRLLLLWLACLAGSLAAAGPSWVGPGGGRYRLLLDRSASMSALTERGTTRFDEARERIREFLAARNAGDRVSLWTMAGTLVPLVAETGDLELVEKELAALVPTAESSDFRSLQAVLVAGETAAHTIVFTDSSLATQSPGDAILFGVGDSKGNVGFISANAEGVWPKKSIRVFGDLKNFSSNEQKRSVVCIDGAGYTQRREFSLISLHSQAFEFTVDRGQGGKIILRLEPADAFAADDEMHLTLAPPPRAPLVLLGPGAASGEFSPLEAAASVLSEEHGFAFARFADPAAAPREAVFLAEGGRFEALPSAGGGAILFGTQIPGLFGEPLLQRPKVTDWKREHPILRGLFFDFLACTKAWSALGEAEPLLFSNEGPLLVGVQRGQARIVASAFRLSDSNLPVQANFPVLLRRAYAWILGNPQDGVPALAWTGGNPAFLDPLESSLETVPVRGPSRPIPEGPGFAREFPGVCVVFGAICLGLLLLLEAQALLLRRCPESVKPQ